MGIYFLICEMNTYIIFMSMTLFFQSNCLTLASLFTLLLFTTCKQKEHVSEPATAQLTEEATQVLPDYDTLLWRELKSEDGYVIDVKYATKDNFVKEIIYPCGRFFLKPEVAKALQKAKEVLEKEGYGLILFDGYRPRPAQQKLWDKVPNPDYVAPPVEGSMHNRGVAIDLSLTDRDGKELNMGTPYDFFGPEAHHDYSQLPAEILERRLKLKSVMESHGFQSIRTEWWHYSFTKSTYPLDDWQWPCEQ